VSALAFLGKPCNGLHWRTGLVVAFVLNQARRQDWGHWMEPPSDTFAGIAAAAVFGGASAPWAAGLRPVKVLPLVQRAMS
jgi:hypothetical protein